MTESQNGGVPEALVQGVFAALVTEPDVGVVIVGWDLRVVYINPWAARFYLDAEPAGVIGKSSEELFGAEVAASHRSNIALLHESGKPLLLRSLWHGKQVRVTLRRIPGETELEDQYLSIHRLAGASAKNEFDPGHEFEPLVSDVVNLGPLDVLSARELEVLALLGQGLAIKEIADTLNRSVKTIDNHRHSIGQKLGQSDRLALAQLAREAGLRVDDARRRRAQQRD